MVRKIIFKHQYGFGDSNVSKEIFEFENDVTEEEIEEEYINWMISLVADSCTWYDEDDE